MADEKVQPPEIVLLGPDGIKSPRVFVHAPGFPEHPGKGLKIRTSLFYRILALLAEEREADECF